jgi:hypothetical protein
LRILPSAVSISARKNLIFLRISLSLLSMGPPRCG